MFTSKAQRRALSVVAATGLLLAVANPAAAIFGQKDGTRNCNNFIAYLHARYNSAAALIPPGGIGHVYEYNDGQWHITESNGGYNGYWYAMGTPYLDLNGTFAGCRNYG